MIGTRLRHIGVAAVTLLDVSISRRRRALFREMRAWERSLPARLRAPLPSALQRLTPPAAAAPAPERTVRRMADTTALLDRRSPLGLCLRRSLTRYFFLRRQGVPVVLHFGAQFVGGRPDRDIAGHAWLTLDRHAYHEADKNWRGFTVMLSFPEE